MRKNVFGRQFGRDSGERKALFKGLASSLVMHERIETTEQKAKAIKGEVEKLVTKAKKGDFHSTHLIQPYLSTEAVTKMIKEIAPRFTTRPGGYTRIIHKGRRLQDNASMVFLEWVEKRPIVVAVKENKKKSKLSANLATAKENVTEIKEAVITPEKKAATKKTTKKVAKPAVKKAVKETTK